MSRRDNSDASLLVGIVLGVVVGAAIAVILTESTQPDRPHLDTGTGVAKAKESLETTATDTKARIEGAAEGAE